MKIIPIWDTKKFIWRKVLVDDIDYEKVKEHKWFMAGAGYAYMHPTRDTTLSMPRYLLNITDPEVHIDHKDRNKLNNQRENLRLTNAINNNYNQGPKRGKKYKGVIFHKATKQFMARIGYGNRLIYLGRFDSEEAAARAYDKASKRYHGEFGYLNFPEEVM